MKYTILLLSLLILPQTTQAADSTENYCHDKDTAKQWEAMVKKTPNDLGLQLLHALRLGICLKIENQTLTFEQGMTIFEREREALIQNRQQKEHNKQNNLVH